MKKRAEETLETPITPMIDVVFQLIIFFVVSAAQQQELLDETIKLAKAQEIGAVSKKDPRTVTINVRQDGSANIANQPLRQPQLENILRAARTEFGTSVPIVIRCDAGAEYRHVAKVMEAVGKAGLYRVQIAAETTK
ncbi:MAG: biopolymer transporter ExbD [Lentisphaeria bacterium]|jgi:biopolymer transport protein ExbD